MSHRNIDAVRTVYGQWSEGDFQAAVDLYDQNIVLVLRPEFPEAGTYLGPEAIAGYTRDLLGSMRDFKIEAEELAAAGDSVFAAVHQTGIGRTSGVATELRYFMLWSFRGGKVIRIESIRERAEALQAAGLSDQPAD